MEGGGAPSSFFKRKRVKIKKRDSLFFFNRSSGKGNFGGPKP